MIISIYSDGVGEVLKAADRFGLVRMGDNPQSLPARHPGGPRIVYGSNPTAQGGFSEELFLNSSAMLSHEFSSSEPSRLINQGLEELAQLKNDTPEPFRRLRKQAVEACIAKDYKVLAGIIVYLSVEDEPVHVNFHAKPLEDVAFAVRDGLLGLTGEEKTDEPPLGGSLLSAPDEAREKLARPDWALLMHTGRLMGSLLLPDAIGGLIESYR